MTRRVIILAIGGIAVAALATGAAWAQSGGQDHGHTQATPFNYEIVDGKRVPKADKRMTNADGSWREETRQGPCVTIKERTPDGAVKTTRKCD